MKSLLSAVCLALLYLTSLTAYAQESSATDQRARNARSGWFLSGRIAQKGQAAADFRQRAHLFRMRAGHVLDARQKDVLAAGNGGEGWRPLGPAPLASDASGFGLHDYGWVSGRATSVVIDRSDITGNTVYLGAAYGGVWKSTNAATPLPSDVIWTPLFDDQPTLAVGAVAVQPGSSRVVLVGTGESNSSTDSYYGLGMFRSADAGATWTQITSSSDGRSFKGLGFSQMVFSSANNSLVVAATGAAPQASLDGLDSRTNRGIYVSSNSGQTWQWASIKDGGVVITPSSVTSVAYDATAHKFFAAIRRHGIYSSPDGLNWSRLASQPGGATGPSALTTATCPADAATNSYICPLYRAQIATVPGRDEVYVWFVDLPGNQGPAADRGIWRSANGGPWVQISDAGLIFCGDLSGCGSENGDYALTLNAVPNGGIATDVYAGAVNLFKCSLNDTSATSCSGGAWLNLSHAYGCSEIGKLHSNQHAADFIVSSGKAIGYFANDGGVYRTPDGYLGLFAGLNGSCSGSNRFESLNETIGSLTQFVSISQHSTDANTLLGGAQGNGFPATSEATSSSAFVNVLSGDGGSTGIVPGSTRWLASTGDLPPGGLNISACDSGIDCRSANFTTLLSSADLAGDDGAYYIPFALDPRASSQLLLGTCRIWRAAIDGTFVTQLSNNFDNGSGNCSGSEVNLVRAVAAGGPAGDHGFSDVVYATTYGSGPLAVSSPAGGRIFVSTNADTATPAFRDMTGSLNSEQYPISSVAIDSSDTTGRTAFITVMGFAVPHVFKTTDAGATWQAFGNVANGLPDTPANSVLVDSEAAQLYVGTDSGVFVSSTMTSAWSEVGPSSGSGHLPNVPVTNLLLFRPDAKNKRLRAATYGRGAWEYVLAAAPDFSVVVKPDTLTIFASQEATFSGTLTANYGYGTALNLACVGAEQLSTCRPNPAQAVPTSDGTPVNVITSAAPGTYPFTLRATGSDSDSTTHDAALTLKVVDFGLSNATPATITVTKAGTSTPTTLSVSASGPFDKTVTLNCTDSLPAGTACVFSPGPVVTPTDSHPANVTLTITSTANTPTGSFPITIEADTPGAPASKQTSLTLTVSSTPDFRMAVNPSTLSVPAGDTADFVGTLSSIEGYANSVTISCGTGAPSTCIGGSFIPSAAGTEFRVKVGSTSTQTFHFDLIGRGTDSNSTQHSLPVTLNSVAKFSMTSDSDTETIPAGGTASFSLSLVPGGGSFDSSVSFSCSSLPSFSRCIFQPATLPAGSPASSVRVDIATTATSAAITPAIKLIYALVVPLLGLGLCGSRPLRRTALAAIVACAITLFPNCGGGLSEPGPGGGHAGTPPGSYSVKVTATSGYLSQQTTVIVIVQ